MKLSTLIPPVLAAAGLRVVTAGSTQTSNSYVKVTYEDGTVKFYDFGECYPFEIHNDLAFEAVWLQSTTCYARESPDCSGVALPIGVPVPKGTILINVADFAQFVGQSALCYENGLL